MRAEAAINIIAKPMVPEGLLASFKSVWESKQGLRYGLQSITAQLHLCCRHNKRFAVMQMPLN